MCWTWSEMLKMLSNDEIKYNAVSWKISLFTVVSKYLPDHNALAMRLGFNVEYLFSG